MVLLDLVREPSTHPKVSNITEQVKTNQSKLYNFISSFSHQKNRPIVKSNYDALLGTVHYGRAGLPLSGGSSRQEESLRQFLDKLGNYGGIFKILMLFSVLVIFFLTVF